MLLLIPVYLLGGAVTIYAKRWTRWRERGDDTDHVLIFLFWLPIVVGAGLWHIAGGLNGAAVIGRFDTLIWHVFRKRVDKNEGGILYRGPVPGDESLMQLRVVDFTTKEIHWMRVPPDMERVKQALAWTFDIAEDDYHPEVTA